MQRSHWILLASFGGVIVLAATAAIAGPSIYRDLVAAPPAEEPTLSGNHGIVEPEDQGDPLHPEDLAGSWEVTEGSEAGYRVDEVLNGTDITVTGRTDQVIGSFTISADGLTLEAAEVSVDVASIATDSEARDDYFRTEAMRVGEHPTATFLLTRPATLTSLPASGDVVDASAVGTLTLAGKTRTVTIDVQVRSDGVTAELVGSIPIVFADYGIEAPNLGFVAVEEQGAVEFDLVVARS